MNPKITSFDEKNFPQIVDFVKPMWSSSTWENSFRRFYSEIILQNSYFKNGLTFQITEDKNPQKLNAAIFFEKQTDKNNVNQWILENSWDFIFYYLFTLLNRVAFSADQAVEKIFSLMFFDQRNTLHTAGVGQIKLIKKQCTVFKNKDFLNRVFI